MDFSQRPIPLLVAVVLLGLLGMSGLLAAPLLLSQAVAAEQLDDHLGAIGGAVLGVAGLTAGVTGALALLGAIGVWRRSAAGWTGGALATGVVTLGLLAALALSRSETALLLGVVLSGAGAIAVWWPDTRRACGTGG